MGGDLRGEKAGGDAEIYGIGSCIEDRMSLKMVNKMRENFHGSLLKGILGNYFQRDLGIDC